MPSFTAVVGRIAVPVLLATQAIASSCVAFDSTFNLYVFGPGGVAHNVGKQSSWGSSPTASAVASEGRPPFDGEKTTCYLAQFFNAIYVLNGDRANPSDVHIYDATANKWSTQKTTTGTLTPATATAILDHDTNVFYAMSGGKIYGADFGSLVTANSTAIEWNLIGDPNFPVTGYKPLMGLAQNHVHFLNVPESQPGTARIFVIHFSYFQPEIQEYPVRGSGSNFPTQDGVVESIFKPEGEGVQQEFFYVPTSGANTYVINVQRNSTTVLAGPTDKSASSFTASPGAIVQLTASGQLFFLPYNEGAAAAAQSGEAWARIQANGLPAVRTSTSSSSPSSTRGGIVSPTGGAAGNTTAAQSSALSQKASLFSVGAMVVAAALGCTL